MILIDQNTDKTSKIMQSIKNEKKYLIEEKELLKIKKDLFQKQYQNRNYYLV